MVPVDLFTDIPHICSYMYNITQYYDNFRILNIIVTKLQDQFNMKISALCVQPLHSY